MWYTAEGVIRELLLALNTNRRKTDSFKINGLTILFKKPEK